MKFTAIADTHGQHRKLILPPADVLIHAGDVSGIGKETEILDFLEWMNNRDYEYKILIAGNHDFYFERASDEQIESIMPQGIIYLKDSGAIIGNFKIWGSPVTPWFLNWAFNRYRGEDIRKYWDLIPKDTDILITHGPVLGILDKNTDGQHCGCEDLYNAVQQIKPKVHVCGHIHEAYGTETKSGTKFINASVLNERYALKNKPVVFEL